MHLKAVMYGFELMAALISKSGQLHAAVLRWSAIAGLRIAANGISASEGSIRLNRLETKLQARQKWFEHRGEEG